MSLATVCPKCQEVFEIPDEIITSIKSQGQVRCGNCNHVFVGLRHALLLDGPMALRVKPSTLEIPVKKKRWLGPVIGILSLLLLCTGAEEMVRLQLRNGTLSPTHVASLQPYAGIFQWSITPVSTLEGLSIGDASFVRNDNKISLQFSISNASSIDIKHPQVKVVFLDNLGTPTFEVRENAAQFSKKPYLSARSIDYLEAIIDIPYDKQVVNYRLSLE